MSAQSPQPTVGQRVGVVLLAALLVGSLVAPIAATGTVAAQNSTDSENECMYDRMNWWIFTCTDENPDQISLDQSASAVEAQIHHDSVATKASYESTDTIISNYVEDTGSIASIEARAEFADAYENGTDPAVADSKAQQAISDYYALKQINLLEDVSVHSKAIADRAETARAHPNVNDKFVHGADDGATVSDNPVENGTVTKTATLTNGSTHTYVIPNFTESSSVNITEDPVSTQSDGTVTHFDTVGGTYEWPGTVHLLNTGDLDSKMVYDYRLVRDRFDELADQSSTLTSNYPDGSAQDFYAKLDSGELSTEDLRGIEGTVRDKSGDADISDQRYQWALRSMFDMDRGSLNTTVVAHYDGATERDRNVSDNGTFQGFEYSSHVNTTYEGMLFADETPPGGFQTGESYDVGALNGTPVMTTPVNGTVQDVHLYQGTLTIQKMTDGDGNEINSTDWDSGADYQTFNATEYTQTMDDAQREQSNIIDTYGGSDGGAGIGWPDLGDGASQQTAAALVVAVVIVAILASLVSDIVDSLGP
ncbi:hypothetical protein [Natrinema ejinorense]|uniref:Envelope protein N-terminal domain-containing protein n=1 Tax=Natrinema ejinorense TaxID=373386 RepID=A0A2A5QWP0_9EURY|nr:hypothetical protein [Natrinema ejinorense]PCR91251.1 hypothetical protein CP557_12380 [Natrinema ejinorense]